MLDDRPYMRAQERRPWSMTMILFVALVVCYVVQLIIETNFPLLAMNLPLSKEGLIEGRYYELLTFQFMHANFWHLAGNLLGLYFFGRAVEDILGGAAMLRLYLLAGTIGGRLQVSLEFLFPTHFAGSVVGASAGIFGLIAAFAAHAPDDPITMLLFFVLPVTFPAKVFLLIMAGYSIFGLLGVFPSNIAHAAHLGGMITGIFVMRGLSWMPKFRVAPRVAPRRISQRETAQPKRYWRRARKRPDEAPTSEFISREVDPILEKISAQGIHSLTEQERQILEAARNKMAKR